ncbi:putative Glutamine amidotransferase class-I [Candidatus Desulfosporosinus infrequens]|uniref:Putative Glutamine amidotransferase class-I n=1 Tax=Candidatus Desulfosporosinus infrequens TaxID=2043169 RepID=A0A2U3LWR9_9FIRM|nr:putative Glutamine amidotransferase class-I [Candidatus Desulfosporosinus infrequens]
MDLIIVHGGSQHLWNKEEDPWLYKEIAYVREALEKNIPVIGFCLGSQIIAESLGGEVYLADEQEVGWFKIFLNLEGRGNILLKSLKEDFISFLWHSDHYSLGEGCKTLSFTEAAANQIIISDSFPAIGFQFHPEYTKENIETYLITSDESCFAVGKYGTGKESFLQETKNMPKTYGLFKVLMNNSIAWFKERGKV